MHTRTTDLEPAHTDAEAATSMDFESMRTYIRVHIHASIQAHKHNDMYLRSESANLDSGRKSFHS